MRTFFRQLSNDVYHRLLRLSWPRLILLFGVLYLVLCSAFAAGYWGIEGAVEGARPNAYLDYLWFSIQTVSTIGYGGMEPDATAAHVLVAIESFLGLLGFALATGLMFAKFSRPTARVVFSDSMVVRECDGEPTLLFRMANERSNVVVEASTSAYLLRDEVAENGRTMRRFYPLELVRNHTPVFGYTFTAMHRLDASSPLHGLTQEVVDERVVAIIVTLTGIDETMASRVHTRKFYSSEDIHFGEAFVDMVEFDGEELYEVDLDVLDETVPTESLEE